MNLLTNHAKYLKIVSAVLALTILSLIIFIIVINSRSPENEVSYQFSISENQTEKITEVERLSNNIQYPAHLTNLSVDFELLEETNKKNAQQPQDIYQLFIEAALKGDTKAQYRVAMAIDECAWDEMLTPQELESAIDQISASGLGFTEEELNVTRDSLKECEGIYKDNPGKNIYIIRDALLSEAASSGLSISIAELAFRLGDYDSPGFSKGVKQEIHKALSNSLNDEFEIDKSLLLAEMYRVNLYEAVDEKNEGAEHIAINAIRIAKCYNKRSYFDRCMAEVVFLHENRHEYYSDPDLSLSAKLAMKIYESIKKGDTSEFDLDKESFF